MTTAYRRRSAGHGRRRRLARSTAPCRGTRVEQREERALGPNARGDQHAPGPRTSSRRSCALGKRYPPARVWLELLDRRVDLIAENFDLDDRTSDPTQSQLIAQRMVNCRRIVCASPEYRKKRSAPRRSIRGLECPLSALRPYVRYWPVSDGRRATIPVIAFLPKRSFAIRMAGVSDDLQPSGK